MMIKPIPVIILLLSLCSVDSIAIEARTALVIGNNAYSHNPLQNAVNDATAVSALLEKLGFSTLLAVNSSKNDMTRQMTAFGDALNQRQGIGLFYFSGHGQQYQGQNLLFPVDADPASTVDIAAGAIALSDILKVMDVAGNKRNIVILDACRDAPFSDYAASASGNGFAELSSAGDGTIIFYATGPGQIAVDGKGDHSPFTKALLTLLAHPDMHVTELFNEVGLLVRKRTNQKQIPWLSSTPFPKLYLASHLSSRNRDHNEEIERVFDSANRLPQTTMPENPWITRLGFHFIDIPPGNYLMGSSQKEDEMPRHSVTVPGFSISAYEVTQGQWRAVMGTNAATMKQCGSSCPVESVSWLDVQQFIETLNKQTGLRFRLPSEAEWEYAARAGSQNEYAFGDDIMTTQANYFDAHPEAIKRDSTVPVHSLAPNAWGLFHIHGNVWEWTQDCWNANYDNAPADASAWLQGNCSARVLRGGGWSFNKEELRVAARRWDSTSKRHPNYGFRLVLDK